MGITKTKSLEQCKKSPFYQMYTRSTVATADLTSGSELGTIMGTTHTYVCGELNEFVVRKVAHKRISELTPAGYNTEERAVSPSQVNMVLLKVRSITARLTVPATTRIINSIVYSFPMEVTGEEQLLSQEIVERTEELIGMRPLLPQPTLVHAPHNVLLSLPKEKIIPQILEQVQKMAREVYQSPESCATKSDLAGKLSLLSLHMRSLDLVELEQLESKIVTASRSTGLKSMEKIFYDILSLVGTNPSTMLQLSNLFYHAYINPITMRNNFPTKVFGVFGTKDSRVLTEEYIPILVEEIERTESEHVRLSAILALGKIGHLKGLKTLVMEIERIVPC